MSAFTDIGNLMYLYLDEIDPGEGTDAPEFLIKATAQQLKDAGGRNWLPTIVKETSKDRYEVVGNAFVYAVVEAAGLERIWCIVADESEVTAKLSQTLSREATPQINLSTASRDDIQAALQYLIEQPGSGFTGIKLPVATNRIDEAPRQYWKTLDPITTLKCGISKGKKLNALKRVFYLTPQPLPDVIRDPAILHSLTTQELKKMAKQRGVAGYTKLKKSDLITQLSL
ncbi:MAG: Rho termination factor N-terminal domain-containing protein [Leptolyngbya sp. UWPOB_LEPTO1]|uniref:Rho termination factor N-terminal domain-containing protein n=1 Tax=Leptolyngbya sp. UWPOB_LEPTO1 TaxID=2815653 RepID=UPI001AC549E9|nr:Rho termination factor N-terminal domain-containing protein [Leptolyngbya sp. UWPOB_LEPTO1]MBN8564532.1 Rho termination factor N-terminal domain-containing protein [Leptolyngbya sp. UWPOB_LEPTO1]